MIPAPGVYMTRKRRITIVAIPVKDGPPFHHWEVDGVNVGPHPDMTIPINRTDHKATAKFRKTKRIP